MIQLITISKASYTWYLNTAVINPNHIVMVTESVEHNTLLREGKIDLELDKRVSFSRVKMSAASGFDEIIVVGSPRSIIEKMGQNKKQLLKG